MSIWNSSEEKKYSGNYSNRIAGDNPLENFDVEHRTLLSGFKKTDRKDEMKKILEEEKARLLDSYYKEREKEIEDNKKFQNLSYEEQQEELRRAEIREYLSKMNQEQLRNYYERGSQILDIYYIKYGKDSEIFETIKNMSAEERMEYYLNDDKILNNNSNRKK